MCKVKVQRRFKIWCSPSVNYSFSQKQNSKSTKKIKYTKGIFFVKLEKERSYESYANPSKYFNKMMKEKFQTFYL